MSHSIRTLLSRFLHAAMKDEFTTKILLVVFVVPIPFTLYLGFGYLDEIGLLPPEPFATYCVVVFPFQVCITLVILFHRIRNHFCHL